MFTISYDEEVVTVTSFFEAVTALGYEPTLLESILDPLKVTSSADLPSTIRSQFSRDRPVVIYFGAKWCAACKVMERTTFEDEVVLDRLKGTSFLKLDVDKSSDEAATMLVSAVPTLVILSSAGEEKFRWVGPLTPTEMNLVLDEHGQ